jgi:BirA family biotin operon repressor/biotin-[acetyl-CoA-carboxylase] ligase
MSTVTRDLGREAVFYQTVSSTNEIAMEEAARGASHGYTVVADAQLGGHGRRGRSWVTPPGKNIALSVVIVPDIPVRSAPLLPVIAAMAMSQTLREAASLQASLKWPNDIVVENHSGGYRKLGGVLLEMRSEAEKIHYAVLGIGLNVSAEAGDFPPEVREIATSVLMETGRSYPRVPLMAAFLDRCSWWLAVHRDHGPETVLKAVRLLSMTIGRTVTIHNGGSAVVEGEAMDIDEDGRLLVHESHTKGLLRVHAGDVTVLGQARDASGG